MDAIGAWGSEARGRREEARFPARLRALADFGKRHRRLPSYWNRDDADEQALGMWLYTLRQAAAAVRLPERGRDALDREAPGWDA